MDEQELDDWFMQEKEKLEETVYKAMANSSDWDKPKNQFDQDYKNLIKKFQAKQAQIYRDQINREKIEKPLKQFREWRKLTIHKIIQWKERQILNFKKWMFDRKIKRILNEKRQTY